MKRQVIVTTCCVCQRVLGCYDSDRIDKKKHCDQCIQKFCPQQTERNSSAFCDAHFEGEARRLFYQGLKNE